MNRSRSLLGLALVGMSSACLASPKVLGTWQCTMTIKAPAGAPEDVKKAIESQGAMVKKMHAVFILKADHTFAVDSTGGPKPGHTTGKWTQSGNTITITTSQKTSVLTVASDGKSMSNTVTQPTFIVTTHFSRP